MGFLGIIGCKSLEEEIAYIVNNDNAEAAKICVLQSESSNNLYNNLVKNNNKNKEVILIEKIEDLPKPSTQLNLLIDVLEMGLHVYTDKLEEKMVQKLKELEPYCSALLIGYGLCGNSLSKLEEKVSPYSIPLIMPVNEDGTRIDDCITMLLGGTEEFRKELYKEPGTWFMPPGWVKNWDIILSKEWGSRDATALKWIFEKTGYKRVLAIPSPAHNKSDFFVQAEDFAQNFELKLEIKEGTLKILENAYKKAKKAANRNSC